MGPETDQQRGAAEVTAEQQADHEDQDIPVDGAEPDGFSAVTANERALAAVRARLGALRDAREELNRSVIAQRNEINRQIRELVVQEEFLERMVRLGDQMIERIDHLPNTERNTDDGGNDGTAA